MAIIKILPGLLAALGSIIVAGAWWRVSGGASALLRAHAEATRFRAYARDTERRPLLTVPISVKVEHKPAEGAVPTGTTEPSKLPGQATAAGNLSPPRALTYQPSVAQSAHPESRVFFNRHLRVKS
jgi:hypothetical protein